MLSLLLLLFYYCNHYINHSAAERVGTYAPTVAPTPAVPTRAPTSANPTLAPTVYVANSAVIPYTIATNAPAHHSGSDPFSNIANKDNSCWLGADRLNGNPLQYQGDPTFYFVLDLGQQYTGESLKFADCSSWCSAYNTKEFQVSMSNDGVTYSSTVTLTTSACSGAIQTLPVGLTGRYLKALSSKYAGHSSGADYIAPYGYPVQTRRQLGIIDDTNPHNSATDATGAYKETVAFDNFMYPFRVTVSPVNGNVYVTDPVANTITKIDSRTSIGTIIIFTNITTIITILLLSLSQS